MAREGAGPGESCQPASKAGSGSRLHGWPALKNARLPMAGVNRPLGAGPGETRPCSSHSCSKMATCKERVKF